MCSKTDLFLKNTYWMYILGNNPIPDAGGLDAAVLDAAALAAAGIGAAEPDAGDLTPITPDDGT
jgi:hypothetical protein